MTRAKLTFRPDRKRGLSFGRHKTTGTWTYTVTANVRGKMAVVFTDNTGGTASRIPTSLFAAAERDVAVVERMFWSGHEFTKSYSELVDEADDF